MRTFFAIEMPPTVQTVIRQTQQELATLLAGASYGQAVRWTAPVAVHLTLRFLGETTEEQRRRLQDAITKLTVAQQPFTLMVQEVGGFPNLQAPNIIWLGLQPENQQLQQLQQQLEQAAQAVGFAAERKPFRPHLTIGRLRQTVTRPQQRAVGQLLTHALTTKAQRSPEATAFVVKQIVHMQSHLEAAGARYTPLHLFNFAAG